MLSGRFKNKGYTNILEGGESRGTVTYKIIEGQDFATIDKVTGKLTFNKAGKIVVEGTKAGDDCYESQSAAYSITTLKKIRRMEHLNLKSQIHRNLPIIQMKISL